jgi:hypothetical protein
MNGKLYAISADGKTVTPYLDLTAAEWKIESSDGFRARSSRALPSHPHSLKAGSRGYGKFYTYLDTSNTSVPADFKPLGGSHTHDTIILEWSAKTPGSASYDGGAPREVGSIRDSPSRITTRTHDVQSAGSAQQCGFWSAVLWAGRRRQRR